MKSLTLWAAVITIVTLVSAIELAPRSPNPRVVQIDIQRRDIPDITEHLKLHRRQKVVDQILENDISLYWMKLTLGTPPQDLRLHIDTGSSDLWVNLANSTICAARRRCIGGSYDIGASSSVKIVNSNFNITYVDGSSALGDYVTDTMTFSGVKLENFQFGTGRTSTSMQGVLGIGYTANEVQVSRGGGRPYPNLPQALVDNGHINRNAYSLWLNDLGASTGSILFGGVDRAKYQGPLVSVPVYQTRTYGYTAFIVALTNFGFNGSAITSTNLPAAVVLDSGSTLSRLPDDIVNLLYQQLDIQYDSRTGLASGYCDLANSATYLEFGFSGINIQVPFNELWLNPGSAAPTRNGRRQCYFGVVPAAGIIPILGDTFLRSAYVVYDLQRNEISLAQTVFNSTSNDVFEIASGTAAISGVSAAASTVSSLRQGTATTGARIGPVTGSYTVSVGTYTGGSGSGNGGGVRTTTVTPSGSANGAYPTKAPFFVGAAVMAGAGLLL